MILREHESLERTIRLSEQGDADRADLDERLQDSREARARYRTVLARVKETLARG
jgi:flagellar motility protein MotE (MotC chaperone)